MPSRKCGITAGAASPLNEPTHSKHTMKKKLLLPGLDVHAQDIALACAEGKGGEARSYGAIRIQMGSLPSWSENSPGIRDIAREATVLPR